MLNVTEPETIPRTCTIASSLAVIGEKWSLLVIRELSLGVHRFDAIQRNTGAPRDILTSRLRRLEAEGVVEKRLVPGAPAAVRVPADAGRATSCGRSSSRSPSGATAGRRRPSQATWVHECGDELDLHHTCAACGGEVTGFDLRLRRRAEITA